MKKCALQNVREYSQERQLGTKQEHGVLQIGAEQAEHDDKIDHMVYQLKPYQGGRILGADAGQQQKEGQAEETKDTENQGCDDDLLVRTIEK